MRFLLVIVMSISSVYAQRDDSRYRVFCDGVLDPFRPFDGRIEVEFQKRGPFSDMQIGSHLLYGRFGRSRRIQSQPTRFQCFSDETCFEARDFGFQGNSISYILSVDKEYLDQDSFRFFGRLFVQTFRFARSVVVTCDSWVD